MYTPNNPIFKNIVNKDAGELSFKKLSFYKIFSLAFSLLLAVIYSLSYVLFSNLNWKYNLIIFVSSFVISIVLYILLSKMNKASFALSILYSLFDGLSLSTISILYKYLTREYFAYACENIVFIITSMIVFSALISSLIDFALRDRIKEFRINFLISLVISVIGIIVIILISDESEILFIIELTLSGLLVSLLFNFMSLVYKECSRHLLNEDNTNYIKLAISTNTLAKWILIEYFNYMRNL